MPTTVALHQLESLAHEDEIIISFPFGNKFDIINEEIIIHSK